MPGVLGLAGLVPLPGPCPLLPLGRQSQQQPETPCRGGACPSWRPAVVATAGLTGLSSQIGLDTAYWTAVNHLFIWGSLATYFAITFIMHSDGIYLVFTASFPFVGRCWASHKARLARLEAFAWGLRGGKGGGASAEPPAGRRAPGHPPAAPCTQPSPSLTGVLVGAPPSWVTRQVGNEEHKSLKNRRGAGTTAAAAHAGPRWPWSPARLGWREPLLASSPASAGQMELPWPRSPSRPFQPLPRSGLGWALLAVGSPGEGGKGIGEPALRGPQALPTLESPPQWGPLSRPAVPHQPCGRAQPSPALPALSLPGTARNTLNQPGVWLAVLLCVALCVLPVVAFRFLKAQLRPTASDQVTPRRARLRGPPAGAPVGWGGARGEGLPGILYSGDCARGLGRRSPVCSSQSVPQPWAVAPSPVGRKRLP